MTPTPPDDDYQVVDCTGVILGNADIVCERATPAPDHAFTLPIYPAPSDLPR